MLDDFFVRALLAGVAVALISAPLGCFIVWRRMAYFGATLSHAALLGVALGFALDIDVRIGVLLICIGVAAALYVLRRQRDLAMDTVLGILAHGALAIGLVVISFIDTVRVDLMGYLFGDILAVSATDLVWIYLSSAMVIGILVMIWRRLLSVTVNADLARVEGENVELIELIFLGLVSIVVAVAMQIVGLLLIVSMMIIPPAIVRPWSATPERMALGAVAVGMVTVFAGLGASLYFDLPAGPAIVSAATVMFVGSVVLRPRGR